MERLSYIQQPTEYSFTKVSVLQIYLAPYLTIKENTAVNHPSMLDFAFFFFLPALAKLRQLSTRCSRVSNKEIQFQQ